MTKVDMEKFTCWIVKHEVTRMSVSNTKHICSDTLASQGTKESFVVIFQTILAFYLWRSLSEHRQLSLVVHEVLHDRLSAKRSAKKVVVLMHLRDNSRLIYVLNIARFESRF